MSDNDSDRYGPLPYPAERALEDAAFGRGVTPTRVLGVLFPVWSVEVETTVTEHQPYTVVERFVERAIAEGRVTTVAELADFLGLDQVIARQAVRSLTAIGHVTGANGDSESLEVTELGLRSLRDGSRITVSDNDRHRLYFDGFTSKPLTSTYYDGQTVTMLDDVAARAVRRSRTEPPFHAVVSFTFDDGALERLASDPERGRFNLPEQCGDLRMVSAARTVWLPIYVVRATDADGRPCCLPYSQTGDTVADDLTPGVEASPLPHLLDTEIEHGRRRDDEKQARAWLRERGLGRFGPTKTRHDTWEVALPASAFDRDGNGGTGGGSARSGRGAGKGNSGSDGHGVPLAKVESYVLLGSGFLRIRCSSEEVRQHALIWRMGAFVARQPHAAAADVQRRLDLYARQLALGTIDLATLRQRADAAGNRTLAAQLAPLL